MLEQDDASVGVAQLQLALAAASPENCGALAIPAHLAGALLGEQGHVPAALAHLHLAMALDPDREEGLLESSLRMIEGNAAISLWLRNPYRLAPPPEGLPDERRDRFVQAVELGESGMWSRAAAEFEALAREGVPGADRNAGLCRLWVAEDAKAAEALRRHVATAGTSTEAVDLEALCQLIAPPGEDDTVEQVHLIWPIRDRDALVRALTESGLAHFEERAPIDPTDPKAPEVDQYILTDRPRPQSTFGLRANDLPRVLARVLVGQEIVALETFDDPRLDRISARFTDLVGAAIPPAHPRTKTLGKVSRAAITLQSEWWLPEGLDRSESRRLGREERARIIREVWPETPQPYLAGKTPRQAARAGGFEVPLRAAIAQLELGHEFFRDGIDFAALRSELGLPEEPAIDPATVDVEATHLARLHRIPADRLDDERLLDLFSRAHQYVLPLAMERAATALVGRPTLFDGPEPQVDRVLVYADLANLALSRDDRDEAFSWLERGRMSDPNGSGNAVRWDFLDVRLRARSESPESWVPQLAVVLERYREDREVGPVLLQNLADMGLLQMVPNPDNPREVLLDSRPLQAVLTKYGPKITTASGHLGVSAAKGAIWTPGGEAGGGGGGIWTPGAGTAPAGGGEKKLIIPGR